MGLYDEMYNHSLLAANPYGKQFRLNLSVIYRVISLNFEFYSAFLIVFISEEVSMKSHIIFSVYLSILNKIITNKNI